MQGPTTHSRIGSRVRVPTVFIGEAIQATLYFLVLAFSLLHCMHIAMDTTPGEFHWAPVPDLAAWSSVRDREAMPNIRQRRPAMDQAQLTRSTAPD